MEIRKPGTREQAFCGIWYDCYVCHSSVLFTSRELDAQLANQRAAIARATQAA